jgi:hypothetical protein
LGFEYGLVVEFDADAPFEFTGTNIVAKEGVIPAAGEYNATAKYIIRFTVKGVQKTIVIASDSDTITVAAPLLEQYTITFNANGGSVNPESALTGADGKLASLPTPTRADYNFNGWFNAPSDGTRVTTDTVFTENTTIHAQWTYTSGSSNTDASLNPATAVFDKYMASTDYKDVSTTLHPGDYTLSAIRNGAYALAAGTDYTVNGNVYTIKKEYLATLGTGAQALTFDMNGGADPVLSITVSNSTPSSPPPYYRYPVIEHFDDFTGGGISDAKVDAPSGKFLRLLLGSNVVNPVNYIITEGSTVITLKESYLKTLSTVRTGMLPTTATAGAKTSA